MRKKNCEEIIRQSYLRQTINHKYSICVYFDFFFWWQKTEMFAVYVMWINFPLFQTKRCTALKSVCETEHQKFVVQVRCKGHFFNWNTLLAINRFRWFNNSNIYECSNIFNPFAHDLVNEMLQIVNKYQFHTKSVIKLFSNWNNRLNLWIHLYLFIN